MAPLETKAAGSTTAVSTLEPSCSGGCGGGWLVVLVVGGWWLVVGGWWLVVGGWWLVVVVGWLVGWLWF